MQVEMTSVGKNSHAQVTVVNDTDAPMPVEAVVNKLTLDEIGRQSFGKAGEEFLVMPPQAMIPPHSRQNFRVQWLGDPMIARSQSFTLMINQIPVKLPQNKSGVQVAMSMGVMINVAPPAGTAALKVVSTGVTTDRAGNRLPVLTVENISQVHALMPQATIELSAGSWATRLPPRSTADHVGIGLVQPGRRRKFVLPVKLPAGVSSFKASVVMAQFR